MQLSPQHLGEVVDHLVTARKSGGNEKRRATRTQVRATVPIYPLGSGAPASQVKVILQDISYMGVGLLQAFPAAPESRFLIRLPRERQEELVIMCVVKNCRELADSIYTVGAEFECPVRNGMIDNVQRTWNEDMQRIQASILG